MLEAGYWDEAVTGPAEGRKDNLRRKQTHKGALDPDINGGTPLVCSLRVKVGCWVPPLHLFQYSGAVTRSCAGTGSGAGTGVESAEGRLRLGLRLEERLGLNLVAERKL